MQVPADQKKEAIASVATVTGSKEVMTKVLTDSGVRDEQNAAPQVANIVSAEASTDTTETATIPAKELPKAMKGQLESAQADKKADDEEEADLAEDEKDTDTGMSAGMIVGIAIGCVALVAVVVGAIFFVSMRRSSKKNSSSCNDNQPGVVVKNPAQGVEMSKPAVAMSVKAQVVQAKPVGGVQPVGYQDGVPYYVDAAGNTTWERP